MFDLKGRGEKGVSALSLKELIFFKDRIQTDFDFA